MDILVILFFSLLIFILFSSALRMVGIVRNLYYLKFRTHKFFDLNGYEMTSEIKMLIKKYYTLIKKHKIKNPPTLKIGKANHVILGKNIYNLTLSNKDIQNNLGYGILLHEFSHIKNNEIFFLHIITLGIYSLLIFAILFNLWLIPLYILSNFYFLKFRRSREFLADQFAAEESKQSILDVLYSIQKKEGDTFKSKLLNTVLTHPPTTTRIRRIH